MRSRLVSLIRKEFIQIRRDRRTLAMMLVIPALWLVIFGYAATFDVRHIKTAIAGNPADPRVAAMVTALEAGGAFDVVETGVAGRAGLEQAIREGRVSVGIVPPGTGTPGLFLADGADFFTAQTAARELQLLLARQGPGTSGAPSVTVAILYNPELRSANVMIPGLVGVVMVFIATIMTAVGVVRERERGTLEQLMVSPLSPLELMVGKIVPYVLISFVDLLVVVAAGVFLFNVPFAGSPVLFLALSLLFLMTCLAIGLLISTVSQTQQQALQLAVFTLLPQILLSGFIFPLAAIPWGVRWVAYLAPLTYFLPIARGIFLKAQGFRDLWGYAAILAGYAVVLVGLAAVQFRRRLL
jgi:ABC-2 type transport system permease protein